MKWRLVVAILTTLLDEAVIAVLLVWGLPQLGVWLPAAVTVTIGVAWLGFAVIMYVNGSKALRMKPLKGLTSMVGTRGIVASDITPEGQVKIKGETWAAESADGSTIHSGEEIIVEKQNGLKLMVRRNNNKDNLTP